jgi:hypothetical protein
MSNNKTSDAKEVQRLHDILERINMVMWQSYMVKNRGITDNDCSKIMELLNEWANDQPRQ